MTDEDLDWRPFPIAGAGACRVCSHEPLQARLLPTVWPVELLECPCPCHETWRAAWQLDGVA